jgi:proteasome lid subunit RPN8/RPN11
VLISKEAYNKLINCPKVPPEVGGILMGIDSKVDTVILDEGIKTAHDPAIKYIPNVKNLNKWILTLNKQGKEFLGIFHTHAHQWTTLSNADIYYIEKIMNTMSDEIKYLYFPVVYPGEKVTSYKAQKKDLHIIINNEKIELVD